MYYLCKVCFVCLRDKNLFNVLDRNEKSFETITFVLPELTISEAEIPVHICSKCNKNLQNVYKLKKTCLENFYERFGSKLQAIFDGKKAVLKKKDDIKNSCFICFADKNLRNFFDEDENDSFNEIAFGLPEIVIADSNISPKVCFKCTSKLLYLYKLKKQYLESYCKWNQFPDKFGVDDNQILSNLQIKLNKIQTKTTDMDAEDSVLSMKQNKFDNVEYNNQDDYKFDNLQITVKTEDVRLEEENLKLEEPLAITEQDESENKNIEDRRSDSVSSTTYKKIYSRYHENIEEYYDKKYVSESEEDIFGDNSEDDKDYKLDSDDMNDSGSNISENDLQNKVSNFRDTLQESNNSEHENSDEGFRGFKNVSLISNKCCKYKYIKDDKSNKPRLKIKQTTNKKTKQNNFKTEERKKRKKKLPEILESKEISGKQSAKIKRFSCSECDQMFTTKDNMTSHLERIHLGIKKEVRFYKCLLCNKELAKDSLKMHYFSHLNLKFHQCSICGNKFVKSNELVNHLKAHTNKKLLKCSICGKIFLHLRDMQIHKRIVHFGCTAHQCSICYKYFMKMSNLKEHLNLHVGTNISCDICNRPYVAYRHLKRHKLEIHNIKQKC